MPADKVEGSSSRSPDCMLLFHLVAKSEATTKIDPCHGLHGQSIKSTVIVVPDAAIAPLNSVRRCLCFHVG